MANYAYFWCFSFGNYSNQCWCKFVTNVEKTKVDKSLNTTFPSETERYEKILEGLKIQLKI